MPKSETTKLEHDYLAALGRLRTGAITSAELLRRFRAGRLKITARTVAEEAQRSHTPLSRSHRHLRKLIESAAIEDSSTTTALSLSDQNSKLRALLKEALSERDALAAHNVALVFQNQTLERKVTQLNRRDGRSV